MPFKNQVNPIKENTEKKGSFLKNSNDDKNQSSFYLLDLINAKKSDPLLNKNTKNKIIESINYINELEKKITNLTIKITELEEQVTLLENACQWVNGENNQLRTQRDCLESENKTFKSELSLNHARDSVTIALKKLKLKKTTELLKENNDLCQKNENLYQIINQLNIERDDLKKEAVENKNQLFILTEKNETLLKSTLGTEKTIENNNEIEILKNKLARSQKDYSHIKADYANLKLDKKNSKLNPIQTELDMKQSFNQVLSKTTTHGALIMPSNEQGLDDSISPTAEISHSNLNQFFPKTNLLDENNLSSESSSYSIFSSRESTRSNTPNVTPLSDLSSSTSLDNVEKTPSFHPKTVRSFSLPSLNSFKSNYKLSPLDESQPENELATLKTEGQFNLPNISLQKETKIKSLPLNDDFQKSLNANLYQQFSAEYTQVLQKDPFLAKNQDLLNNLINLKSKNLTCQTLADDVVKTLLNEANSNVNVNPLFNELTHSSFEHSAPQRINILLQKLKEANLLDPALEENRDRANRLLQLTQALISTFKEENHSKIIEAFTQEFIKIATQTAQNLYNAPITKDSLTDFENTLQVRARAHVKDLILNLFKKPELFSGTLEKIHHHNLTINHLEEIEKLIPYIFETVQLNDKNYNTVITDLGIDVLIDCCIKKLQRNERDNLLEIAKTILNNKASNQNLTVTQRTDTIIKASQELVDPLLRTNAIKNSMESLKNNRPTHSNFLDAAKEKLQKQLQQTIDQRFEYYFPNLHLDPIFKKINANRILSVHSPQNSIDQMLTEAEKSVFPLELQYTDSPAEFIAGLQFKYPYLRNQNNRIDEETFEELRLVLRKKSLEALNKTFPKDKDIIHLECEQWLKKKLQLITNQPIKVKLESKLQKDLDNEIKKSFSLTPLTDEAITSKSIPVLESELNKLYTFKNRLFDKLHQVLSEIDSTLRFYPNLIEEKDVEIFKTNLNKALLSTSISINNAQIKILLEKINNRLALNSNKWTYFNKKLIGVIAHDIIAGNAILFPFDNANILTLVENALQQLSQCHDLQGTQQKRNQWKLRIQWLFAFSQKLESLNQSLHIRIAKLDNMQAIKKTDIIQGHDTSLDSKTPGAVYLPHHCCIVSHPLENNLLASYFSIKSDAFYKQNALEVKQKLTFEQTLSTKEKRTWSVTRSDDKSLTYETYKSWKDAHHTITDRMGYETNYVKEISFAQMIHAVNSFKEGSICTLHMGKCSIDMEKKLRLFIAAYNELRNNQGPLLLCNSNLEFKIKHSEVEAIKTEIKNKLKLQSHELDNVNKQLSQPVDMPTTSRFW